MNRAMTKNLVTAILLLFTSITVQAVQGPPPANVNVMKAEQTTLAPAAWVTGTVVSRNNTELASEVSGRLTYIADLGSQLKAGDIVAKLDDSILKLDLAEAQANVNNEKAKVKFEKAEVTRKKSLLARKLISDTELEETQSNYEKAKATLAAAKARLEQIKTNINYSEVKAPFSGMVTDRLSNLGEYVNSGNAIVKLVETDNVEAALHAPLTAYTYLKAGQSLAIKSPLGSAEAPVKSIIPVADTRSHLMEIRLDMSNVDWPIGLNLKASVANGESKTVIAVPRDSLVLRRNATSVFKIDNNNTAQQVNVTIGVASGDLVEVIGDINVGDQVVVRGAERLRPGQPVAIKNNNQQLVSSKQ